MQRDRNVDAYIAALPPKRRKAMEDLRANLHAAIGEGVETIKYKMPAFVTSDLVCTIAAQKRYFAIYICDPDLLDGFRERFAGLDLGKGCIRFKDFDDLPPDALRDLIAEAVRNPGWQH